METGREGIDLMKMAVSILLATLVAAALIFIGNRIFAWIGQGTSNVSTNVKNALTDKFLELDDISGSADGLTGNYPLVTTVCSTLLEGSSPDMLYYVIVQPDGTPLVAYTSYDASVISVTGANYTTNAEEATANCLIKYSGDRCAVNVIGQDGSLPLGMLAVEIYLK